jgi:hypothetical protein
LNKKKSMYIVIIGLLLNAFAILCSTLFGFGGFSMKTFSDYVIIGYVSRLQMTFLSLVGLGLILAGIGYASQTDKKTENSKFILLSYLAVSIIFFTLAVFGLTSQLRGNEFLADTTFKEIQNMLFFNSLSLTSFLAFGTLQLILSLILFRTKMFQQHQLSKAAKILTLTSGILWIVKSMIDYPLIKESIFILSYTFKFPFPNNLLSIMAPLIYLSAQILITIILLHNQKSSINQ